MSAVNGLCFTFFLLRYVSYASAHSCTFSTQRVQCGNLACNVEFGVCAPCNVSDDCYPDAMDCSLGKCIVGSFARNFSYLVSLAMICTFFICSIAVLAGVGGGGILVPLFCLLMKLPLNVAVGLSQSTICGQSTLNMFFAVRRRYPSQACSRPLINYQYLALLVPMGGVGILVGGLLSRLCPDILRLALLFLLLTLVLYRTVKKVVAQYREDNVSATEPHGTSCSNEEAEYAVAEAGQDTPAFTQPQFPCLEIACFFLVFLINVVFNVWRTKTTCGDSLYVTAFCLPVLLNFAVFLLYRRKLGRLEKKMLTFSWTFHTSVLHPLVTFVAGVAAAMLGIGGGLVLGFVLYEAKLIPEEVSATSGSVTFFLALSAIISLLVEGQFIFDYGCIFLVCGVVSTVFGQMFLMRLIKKYKLRYLIVASLTFIVGGSLAVLSSYGIYNIVTVAQAGGAIMGFGRVCPVDVSSG